MCQIPGAGVPPGGGVASSELGSASEPSSSPVFRSSFCGQAAARCQLVQQAKTQACCMSQAGMAQSAMVDFKSAQVHAYPSLSRTDASMCE